MYMMDAKDFGGGASSMPTLLTRDEIRINHHRALVLVWARAGRRETINWQQLSLFW
jgi:hypothetical protein